MAAAKKKRRIAIPKGFRRTKFMGRTVLVRKGRKKKD